MESLFARYLPRVRRMVAIRMRTPVSEMADVEDLVQETMLDAVRSLDHLELRSDGAFCHWLATIVGNNVRDELRRAGARRAGGQRIRRYSELTDSSLSESIFAGKLPPPSEQARIHETELKLEHALLQLGDRFREVINLRSFGGMSFREIAEQMQLPSENMANVLFLRARKKLRILFEARADPE